MATTKKTGGAKTTRSETVTVRLDPELRYLAEIASRIQRRTLSSYIEWAILKSLELNILGDTAPEDMRTVADRAGDLWDVDEADRFAKLCFHAPHLLNYDEQRLWKVIREYGRLWAGHWVDIEGGKKQLWRWEVHQDCLVFLVLRNRWELLNAVARGEKEFQHLPDWNDIRDNPDYSPAKPE